MDNFDPLKEARKSEFPKELKNMGIDKDSITNIAEQPEPIAPKPLPPDQTEKLMPKIQAAEQHISQIEARISGIVKSMNDALARFDQRICSLETNARAPIQAPRKTDTPALKPEEQKTLKKDSDKLEPGDIKIEDYFNFSNAKFK